MPFVPIIGNQKTIKKVCLCPSDDVCLSLFFSKINAALTFMGLKFRRIITAGVAAFLFMTATARPFSQTVAAGANEIRILVLQGRVEIAHGDAGAWLPAHANDVLHPTDRVRTGENSRVALRWSDQSVVPFSASTELEILPPAASGDQFGLQLFHGILSFFHRDKPGHIRVVTHGAVAGIEGTEFLLAADDAGRATLSVVDGKVKLSNGQGTIQLTSGEQAVVEPGQAPKRTAGFIANNLLQWCFYYPAVIDPDELQLTADEKGALADSLSAYRSGDLLAALARYPAGRPNTSDRELVYHAALLLSVGEVEKTEYLLSLVSDHSGRPEQLAAALRELIAAVKRQDGVAVSHPQLASEMLAGSYLEQSHALRGVSLEKALMLAKQATVVSPKFGFAWERAAELEFSFGHTREALRDLNTSLELAPRNAQALALKGFVLAADNQPREARKWFDQAIALDSALANAWLGRGLVRIHLGDDAGGREDLLVAAALEPQRAELRSYLGKAYANDGDDQRATKELAMANKLDPKDPTPWLYAALLDQQNNNVNDSIRDLEKSQTLNDNRSVYRSQLLLDQDSAVRSANLAGMYQDAGMTLWGINEAGRAVNYDYANYSAHLFLANSYSDLRDPNLINERYETPSVVEYFLANLLAPVSAGILSPTVSQQEYSALFNQNRVGVVSESDYLSRGAWSESGVQYGIYNDFSYSFEGDYSSDPGQRPNEDLENRFYDLSLKYQLAPADTLWGSVQWSYINAGDTSENYYNAGDPTFSENQNPDANVPTAEIGYHHEWSPGVQTLFMAVRSDGGLSFFTENAPAPWLQYNVFGETAPTPTLDWAAQDTMHEQYYGREKLYSAELQQIWEEAEHTTIIGARMQYGYFDVTNEENDSASWPALFPNSSTPTWETNTSSLFKRFSIYGYHQWQILDPLQLIGGVTYDYMTYPVNFLYAPTSSQDKTVNKVSPKAGMIWTPLDNTTVRFAYTRSLDGMDVDQSYQLEPPQVAGFVQSFRSIIPESVGGPNSGAEFETYDLSLEQKFKTGTYLAVSAELLNATLDRVDGAFYYDYNLYNQLPYAIGLRENLDYTERSVQFTANQLVGRDWSLGAFYRLSDAVLVDTFPDVPTGLPQVLESGGYGSFEPRQRTEGLLHQVDLTAFYNHPSGFFAEGEAVFFDQSNYGYPTVTTSGTSPAEPGDNFWQFNAYAGWRFLHRRAEVTLGVLNIGDQNYALNPLNLYNEMPRSRTLLARLRINF